MHFHRQQFHRQQQPPPAPIQSSTVTLTQRTFLTSVLKSEHTWLIEVRGPNTAPARWGTGRWRHMPQRAPHISSLL